MTTKDFMQKVRRKLTELQKMENAHCGIPERLEKVTRFRIELENLIEGEHRYWSENRGPG